VQQLYRISPLIAYVSSLEQFMPTIDAKRKTGVTAQADIETIPVSMDFAHVDPSRQAAAFLKAAGPPQHLAKWQSFPCTPR
jgi:hypothetical protein